jgi:addiction module HigA family antidote
MSRKLKPVTPGEMLAEEFLKPLGMSNYRLAKEIGVPAQRIGVILAGKRAVTADTDLQLCCYFGLSDGWWLRLQADYETEVSRASLAKTLAKIRPWKVAAEQTADVNCCAASVRRRRDGKNSATKLWGNDTLWHLTPALFGPARNDRWAR